MRLTLLAVASETGLGYQTRSYYKWLKPDRTIIIDISNLNGSTQHYDWYPDATVIKGIPRQSDFDHILDTDIILTAETIYNLELYAEAKKRGVKTVCVENPEFYDHIKYPHYAMPDTIILPSVWLEPEIRKHAEGRGTKVFQIHHPVDREEHPFRLRSGHNFMHIAGKPATQDRNGTWDYMKVCPDGRVAVQNHDLSKQIAMRHRNAKIYDRITDNKVLYELGDILVFPRRYGGNCLPLNEALSSGMPVIMPDISPNNHLLPKHWLVPAYKTASFEPRGIVDIHSVDIFALQQKIEWFKQCDIQEESKLADEIAESISWPTLLPKYKEAIW